MRKIHGKVLVAGKREIFLYGRECCFRKVSVAAIVYNRRGEFLEGLLAGKKNK
jgi:hypothetical protein